MLKHRKKHIAEVYLDYIGVRFSRKYFSEIIDNNPFPNTFAGIRQLLLNFNIRSSGISLSREELLVITDPFITILPEIFDDFVVVTEISDNNIHLLSNRGIPEKLDVDVFFERWDGSILFPEVSQESEEPDYIRNTIISISDRLKIPFTVIIALTLIAIILLNVHSKTDIWFSLVLISLYCAGSIVSGLLIMESINVHNPLVSKICNAGPKISCITVLESKSSRLFGLIGWSEIGLIYFLGSLLFFLVCPHNVSILFLVSIFALPYTVWSIAYQWFVTKKWCPLCLAVQGVLWLQFIIFIIGDLDFQLSDISIYSAAAYILCMIIPAMAIWWAIPHISKANERNYLKRTLLKMKSNETVFKNLLEKSEECKLPESARQIVLGNKDAKNTVTIISNPYCKHCANFHIRLVRFLNLRDDFKAEIVFVGEDMVEEIIKKLISAYFIHGPLSAEAIYNEWFEIQEKIFQRYTLVPNSDEANTIYELSRKWHRDNNRIGTPSVYVNNRLLPEEYILEDLHFLY